MVLISSGIVGEINTTNMALERIVLLHYEAV